MTSIDVLLFKDVDKDFVKVPQQPLNGNISRYASFKSYFTITCTHFEHYVVEFKQKQSLIMTPVCDVIESVCGFKHVSLVAFAVH